jgi:ATP-dependent Lon protease
VREVILPQENEVNVREDLKTEQIGEMKVHYVKTMEQVVELALCPVEARQA